jgi:hypothetical protein
MPPLSSVSPSETGPRIILGRRGDRVLPATATNPPDSPDSYAVSIPASGLVVVEGSDPAGANRYTAQVPLTPEGVLYYFEAADDDGNTLRWPDFLKETPYLAINPWSP